MPWACAGHPALELPRTVDGVELRDEAALREVAARVLRGWHPPGAREADEVRVSWLRRLYARLANRAPLGETVLAFAKDPDVEVRGRVLVSFKSVAEPSVLAKLVPLLDEPALFVGVRDPISSIRNETLEDSLWRDLRPVSTRTWT